MNAQVFGTGTNFDSWLPWIIAGVVLYFGVLPALPSMIAGWRYFGKGLGAPAALGVLYGLLIAVGLAAIITPWAYLPGMIWWLAVAPPAVAVGGPVTINCVRHHLVQRRNRQGD